jgi:hypothetical protein
VPAGGYARTAPFFICLRRAAMRSVCVAGSLKIHPPIQGRTESLRTTAVVAVSDVGGFPHHDERMAA